MNTLEVTMAGMLAYIPLIMRDEYSACLISSTPETSGRDG